MRLAIAWVLASALCVGHLLASEDEPPADVDASKLETGTPAKPLKRREPTYPKALAAERYEGFVVVSFMVKTDGSVGDVIIEDSTGPAFEDSVREAVQTWKYEPATFGGVPVEQAYTSVLLTFYLDGRRPGARPSFIRTYREVVQQLEDGKIEPAERRINELLQSEGLSLSERAYSSLMDAFLRVKKGENDRALRSLQRATLSNGGFLERSAYAGALQQMFLLEIRKGRLRDALGAYERLSQLEKPPDQLAELAQRARTLRDGPDPIGAPGRVATPDEIDSGEAPRIWSHSLLRRQLAFQDVVGTLDAVEFRCSRHRARDAFSTEKIWKIPASWGSCGVYVTGAPGSTFTLVEYAPEPEPASTAD
jgi:TonB family protein